MKFRAEILMALVAALLLMAEGSGTAQKPRVEQQATKADGHGTPAADVSASIATAPAVSPDYMIGPDDVLVVNIWKEPDLSRSVVVRPDGKISLPLLKDIDASGNTTGRLQARIEQALADYISKPSVTVIVQEARSHKFNILGAVQKPGSYVITGPMTVLDAIALAGGLREWAKTGGIYVLRETSPGARERIPFNYKKVVKGSSPDIVLKIKDTIIVP